MALAVAPEAKHVVKKFPASSVRLRALFTSILFLLAIPGIAFLNRGIQSNLVCGSDFDKCQEACEEMKKLFTDKILFGGGNVDKREKDAVLECPSLCENVYDDCSEEAQLHVIATGCVAACLGCTLFLAQMMLGLMVLKEKMADMPASPKRRRRGVMTRGGSVSSLGSAGSRRLSTNMLERMASIARGGDQQSEMLDSLSSDAGANDRKLHCTSCEAEIPQKYIDAKPKVAWSTSCLSSAPLYCPQCYNVQYGFI